MTTRSSREREVVETSDAMGCEEVLLPGLVTGNGVTEQLDFIEENDPMADILADIASIDDGIDAGSTPEQVTVLLPKKRKNAIHENSTPKNPTENLENGINLAQDEEELPTSSGRLNSNKENEVDDQQCRVCTTKVDLVNLFKLLEKQTIADMLMTICPSVSIAPKDFMPQYICNPCLDNVTIAIQLKTQCEKTEAELRKKLSRSKNKVRRPTGYIVIDAPVESDPPTEEEPNDDEFKVSASDASIDDSDDDDSDYGSKKKRYSRGAGAKRGRRKSAITTPKPKFKEKKRPGRPPLYRSTTLATNSSDEETVNTNGQPQTKKARRNEADDEPTEYPCDECQQVFKRKLSLKLHKKAHEVREPIKCEYCGKEFRVKGAYRTHLEKHASMDHGHNCTKCSRILSSRADLKRHMAEEHGAEGLLYECTQCKRNFVTETRLQKHQGNRCPGYIELKQKRTELDGYAVGKDLFKTVAPLTTTYWSDSFSD